MAEQLHIQAERHEKPVAIAEHSEHVVKQAEAGHIESHHEHSMRMAEARQHVKQEAINNHHLEDLKTEAEPTLATPQQINHELKQITLRRELQHIRHRLPAPQRAFSRIIHQPAVRLISEQLGKSVSRPSGLLGGGLVAFVGTGTYLYLAKHIGFTYHYGVFAALFIGGFGLGLMLEFVVYLVTASRRRVE